MNRIAAIGIALALVTGLVAGQLLSFVSVPAPIAANTESRATKVAETFYLGMNRILEQGDSDLMRTVLAESFQDHAMPSQSARNANDLENWVYGLARSSQHVQVEVSSTVTHDGYVISTLDFVLPNPAEAGTLASSLEATNTVQDVLLIENGQIVERWSASADRLGWTHAIGQVEFELQAQMRQIVTEALAGTKKTRIRKWVDLNTMVKKGSQA